MSLSTKLQRFLEQDPPGAEWPLLVTFLERMVESVSPPGQEADLRELAHQLRDTFAFIRVRKRRQILIRVVPAHDRTLLEVLMPEQHFVLDTIEMALHARNLEVISKQHVTGLFLRERGGRLTAFEANGEASVRETLVRVELRGSEAYETRDSLIADLRSRLEIARQVVRNFRRMRSALRGSARVLKTLAERAPEQERGDWLEARAFLRWLCQENFILFGISDPSRSLGYVEIPAAEVAQAGVMIERMQRASGVLSTVMVYKGMEDARIHRAGKVDNVLIRTFDDAGKELGFLHVRGMFTYKAVQTPASQIPIIRRKLADYLRDLELKPGSIQHRAAAGAFNTLPVEFLFEAPKHEIAAVIDLSLRVERTREAGTHLVIDKGNQKALYFVAIPQAGYSEDLRRRIAEMLTAHFQPNFSDSRVQMGKNGVFMLAFFLTSPGRFPEFVRGELDQRVRALAGTWEERFLHALEERVGRDASRLLHNRWARAFPRGYQLLEEPAEAVIDVEHLERLRARAEDASIGIELELLSTERDRALKSARLRVYLRKNLYLSTILPIFDHFGLQIIEQSAERVAVSAAEEYFVQTYRVAGMDGPLLARKGPLLEALRVVLTGRVASDALNRLILLPELEWLDLELLRASVFYLRQLGLPHLLQFVASTLEQNSELTLILFRFYRARFDPGETGTREERAQRCQELKTRFLDGLSGVRSSEEDAYFRVLLNLFESTLRTSRYLARSIENHRISFKIDSRMLKLGSDPRPWREIYVYHLMVEGIHLRGGKIARGGIRWSDRITDYREEVLGLMRTQMVKNVLIVPVGAKGGFILRRPAASVAARREQADAMYKIFIEGLLDLTDNVVEGQNVSPTGLICYDDADSYLVVAADKGTAHLSDVANAISLGRGFWLGDAFASGGSNGYDHKALAITALGVWEQVKRHFFEMKRDIDRTPFTVAGIGDMAGDVFGNGMLRSRNIKLVAAFNHQHIFLDPAPDPESSYKERERLFRLRGSTWADYGVLSPGGAVHDRHAKSITLSAESRALLGLEEGEKKPEEIIRAILMLDVDLIWNGGIGAYVKASWEDNREVGDSANADVRVNANKVRARIIAEGGNLGLTQAGRIEYALRGGRLNTDFVDNSGGVDCSDHEVNLKILLKRETDAGRISFPVRNDLLRALRDDVTAAVIADSRGQGVMISLDEARSRRDLYAFERLIQQCVEDGSLQRERDRLPTFEQLQTRRTQGAGMTRPELALLAAHAKMRLTQQLLDLPPAALPKMREHLLAYFPARVIQEHEALVIAHPLAREIAVAVLTNHIVDQAGAAFISETARECGAPLVRITHAYLTVEELLGARAAREEMVQSQVASDALYRGLLLIEEAVRKGVVWSLEGGGERLQRLETESTAYALGFEEWRASLPSFLSKQERVRYERVRDELVAARLDPRLAEKIAVLSFATYGLASQELARSLRLPLANVARLYFEMARASQVLGFLRRSEEKGFAGRWDSLAFRMLRNKFLESLARLVAKWAERLGDPNADWLERATAQLKEDRALAELRAEMKKLGEQDDVGIATLQVVAMRFQRLVDF